MLEYWEWRDKKEKKEKKQKEKSKKQNKGKSERLFAVEVICDRAMARSGSSKAFIAVCKNIPS
jgi:hypothetical protein